MTDCSYQTCPIHYPVRRARRIRIDDVRPGDVLYACDPRVNEHCMCVVTSVMLYGCVCCEHAPLSPNHVHVHWIGYKFATPYYASDSWIDRHAVLISRLEIE